MLNTLFWSGNTRLSTSLATYSPGYSAQPEPCRAPPNSDGNFEDEFENLKASWKRCGVVLTSTTKGIWDTSSHVCNIKGKSHESLTKAVHRLDQRHIRTLLPKRIRGFRGIGFKHDNLLLTCFDASHKYWVQENRLKSVSHGVMFFKRRWAWFYHLGHFCSWLHNHW